VGPGNGNKKMRAEFLPRKILYRRPLARTRRTGDNITVETGSRNFVRLYTLYV
jgi:hypothetical protein